MEPRVIRDGYLYALSFAAVSVLIFLLTKDWYWAIVPLPLAVFFLWFFRNPQRTIPQTPGVVVSPADGTVTEVGEVVTPKGLQIRISIFLSVFDVHINRAPVTGKLTSVRYQRGQFLNAMNPESALRNERTIAVIEDCDGIEVTSTLIAGLLARRIVFLPRKGEFVERGQHVGMIKFGSRCDVLLPPGATTLVHRGDRVRGGSTTLARLW